MKIIVVGVGDIGYELAQELARREENEIVLVELDKARAAELSQTLDAFVLNGDGTSPEVLEKAHLDEADALVATTGSDPLNTVIAMLGHRAGIRKIIVKLDEVGLHSACRELGVSEIVAPKIAAAGQIVAALYGLRRLDLSLLSHGGLQMAELPAGTAAGQTLSQLGLPQEALVVAVVRNSHILVARGDTSIQHNDLLLILTKDENTLKQVKSILSPE